MNIGGKYDATAAWKAQRDRERLEAFTEWVRKAGIIWAAWCRMLEAWKALPMDDPRFEYAYHRLDYAGHIYETIFIGGDFKAQTEFYKTHAGEVREIERRFLQGQAA